MIVSFLATVMISTRSKINSIRKTTISTTASSKTINKTLSSSNTSSLQTTTSMMATTRIHLKIIIINPTNNPIQTFIERSNSMDTMINIKKSR